MRRPESRLRSDRRKLPRFASRAAGRPGFTAALALDLMHKLVTGGAALAALLRLLF